MSSKVKGTALRGDAKASGRPRQVKEENWKSSLGDSNKKSLPRREVAEARAKRMNAGSNPSVQQKAQVPTAGWVKGGCSPSFADIVRKKTDVVIPDLQEQHTAVVAVPIETPELDVIPNGDAAISQPLAIANEEVTFSGMETNDPVPHNVVLQAPLETVEEEEEEEIEEMAPIRYYVLEIDRVGEELMVLPPRITQYAAEHDGTYTFSGQAGKPPTPPTAQMQPQFFRPENASTRSFGGMTGNTELNRSAPWGTQSSHSVDYVNWSLPDRHQRAFHQGMQYNSYAAPGQQQAQRGFVSLPTNRSRQHDMMPDSSLRALRDGGVAGPFNRHPGNSGGVW